MSPTAYRARGFAVDTTMDEAHGHRDFIEDVGPCIKLYHFHETDPRRHTMEYAITKTEVAPQPVLIRSFRVNRTEISKAIGEGLESVFGYAQRHGLALTGRPFARYPDVGPGQLTIEPGMYVSGDHEPRDPDDTGVAIEILPGGLLASTVHAGPYETLPEAYAALEAWMAAEGLTKNGAPWEIYVTDPMATPDQAAWRTEVCWPVK